MDLSEAMRDRLMRRWAPEYLERVQEAVEYTAKRARVTQGTPASQAEALAYLEAQGYTVEVMPPREP